MTYFFIAMASLLAAPAGLGLHKVAIPWTGKVARPTRYPGWAQLMLWQSLCFQHTTEDGVQGVSILVFTEHDRVGNNNLVAFCDRWADFFAVFAAWINHSTHLKVQH